MKDFLIEKKKWMILVILVILGVLGVGVFTGIINTPLTDPLAGFQGPIYVPEGYVSMENNSTANVDKSFTYADKNDNYFIVAAVKDVDKSEYGELMNDSFASEEMEGLKTVKEEILVDGHPVTFKILNMDFMGMQMNMFHATWTCPQSGLNMVATGEIGANETETMKKMVASVQCHQEKQSWKIPGL